MVRHVDFLQELPLNWHEFPTKNLLSFIFRPPDPSFGAILFGCQFQPFLFEVSNEKRVPACLGYISYIRDYTTLSYRIYNMQIIRIPIKQPAFHGRQGRFFVSVAQVSPEIGVFWLIPRLEPQPLGFDSDPSQVLGQKLLGFTPPRSLTYIAPEKWMGLED